MLHQHLLNIAVTFKMKTMMEMLDSPDVTARIANVYFVFVWQLLLHV